MLGHLMHHGRGVQTQEAERLAAAGPEVATADEPAVHEANEWGIETVPEQPVSSAGPGSSSGPAALPQGLQYSMPVRNPLHCHRCHYLDGHCTIVLCTCSGSNSFIEM